MGPACPSLRCDGNNDCNSEVAMLDQSPAPMAPTELRRAALLILDVLVQLRVPYVWGHQSLRGMDCSGAVRWLWPLLGIAPPGYDANVADLQERCPPILEVEALPGDLAFYGRELATHVMVWVGPGRVVGATGGGEHTTSLELARAADARVKYESLLYRADFIGLGRAPFPA